ncbi:hypothetical protein KBK24_0119300 [Burkholderia sp. K24]|nr:hypothetical protein KBK24_0119300 [Burkholderia sp. K24]
MTDRQLDAFRKFLKLLPHGKDIELIVLKAHLLIEEQIHLIVRRHLRNPDALGKLSCDKAISLAQALHPPGHDPSIWDAVRKLNILRNEIAHQLDSVKRQEKMDALVLSFPGGFDSIAKTDQDRFELTIWSVFVAVSDLADQAPQKE